MELIGDSLAVCACVILVACFLPPLWKKRQKRRQEAKEKAEKELLRTLTLQDKGQNIDADVREVDGNYIRARGKHPDTGAFLFFVGIKPADTKQYEIGDPIKVRVDPQDPTNYKIHWETDPWKLAEKLVREQTEQRKRDEVLFTPKYISRNDELSFRGNKRALKKDGRLRNDEDFLWKFNEKDTSSARRTKSKPQRLKKKKCPLCKGTGTVMGDCIRCKGKRQMKVERYILGKKRVIKENCLACNGRGKSFTQCRRCDGDKYIFFE